MSKTLEFTSLEEIVSIHDSLVAAFNSGKTRPIEFRKKQLSQLAYMVKDNVTKFESALVEDLGRPQLETHLLEVSGCINDAVEAYNCVDKWAQTERAPFSLNFAALGPKVRKEAKGVVLIISPFNYPAWLCLGPMAGAIAAGNAVVLKPSEMTPATSALLAELFPKYLDSSLYRVINGGIPETTKILELKWDHILYTGNGKVGRIVSQAAAKHLTPVSLELGGKNPTFIDPKCNISLACRRIAWGKFSNCGQSCTATDYIIVPEEALERVNSAFTEVFKQFYPDGPLKSQSYSRIVSDVHFKRLSGLLAETKGTIALGGETDAAQKYIAPTIVTGVKIDDALMSQEIFGPILPIITVKDVNEALSIINAKEHPLVAYIFSDDEALKTKYFDSTRSGAAIANETLLHPGVHGLPFGGVGESGHGYHTGKYGFDMFTHHRATIDSPGWLDKVLGSRYPPYSVKKLTSLQKLIYPTMPPRGGQASGWFGGRLFATLLCVSLAVGLGARLTGTHVDVLAYIRRLLFHSGR